jgi:uncharacterized membrane protein
LFLLTISFTPFPTALLGLYPTRPASATLLSGAMFLTASSFLLMRWYATRHAGLIKPQHNATAAVALRRSMVAPVIYAAAIGAAQVAVPAAIVLLIVVPVLFFFPVQSRDAG